MEASTNGSSFGIDSLLSHRPGSPLSKADGLLPGECRSPLEFSPRSDVESGCSSPPSPRRECVEEAAQRQVHSAGLPPHLQHAQISAGAQQRTVTSSFLIRDILADCKPLAACAPYSSNGQPTQEAGRLAAKIADDFIEKIHSNSSSDSEYKGSSSPRPPKYFLLFLNFSFRKQKKTNNKNNFLHVIQIYAVLIMIHLWLKG